MTEENYKYRTSPFFLRNQFHGVGKLKIPTIPKSYFREEDFTNLKLISFDKTSLENKNHLDRMVHFFLYDYKFERVWKNPENDLEKLKRYRAVLTPDFSVYREMAPVMQLYNTFRNRWCGAYFVSKGIRVIPSVSWGDENTFDFCFEGIPKGSVVAVSTYMVSEHNNHSDQKDFFLKGYNELLRRIEPEKIICYNEPFPEMQGDIVFVDYDLSSWRYMNDDPYVPSKYMSYITGEKPLPPNSEIIIKSGFVIRDDVLLKGMGSAFGGKWKPTKPDDDRLLGKPGEIKETIARGGYRRLTKIGIDGRAILERHYTDKPNSKYHTNPHDHSIDWSSGFPKPSPPINYYDTIPEFKSFRKGESMTTVIKTNSSEDDRFKSISDFKWCINAGGEVVFIWNGKTYGISPKLKKSPELPEQILISQILIENQEETEMWCDSPDEALEYRIDGIRLRDIITEVEVTDRTI